MGRHGTVSRLRRLTCAVVLALLGVFGWPVRPAVGGCDRIDELVRRVRAVEPRAEVELSPSLLRLRVRLRSPEGPVLAERTFQPSGTCDELAEVALTFIQAWQTTLPPMRTAPAQLKRLRRLELELGAGFAATVSGRDYASGALVTVLVGPRGGLVRARIAVFGATPHELSLGDGVVRYARVNLSVGPAVTFRPSRLVIDLRGEFAIALLMLDAVGYSQTQRAFDADPAIGGGMRLGVRVGPVLPFLDLAVYGYLRSQRAYIEGLNEIRALPRFEGVFSVGIAGFVL